MAIKAIALVGFYRGEQLVQPGQVIDLPELEFGELRAFCKVDFAPTPVAAAVKKAVQSPIK